MKARATDPGHDSKASRQPSPAPDRDPWRVEGSRRPTPGQQPPRHSWFIWIWLLVAALLFWAIVRTPSSSTTPHRVNLPYSVFRAQVHEHNVARITATGETIQGELRVAIHYPAGVTGQTSKAFKTERPIFANDQIFQQLLAEGATVGANSTTSANPWWASLLLGFGPTLLLIGLFVMLFRGASRSLGGGPGAFSGFGKAPARRYEPSEQRTTFEDVAGIDEATEELAEVVDFLKHPGRYRALGAIVPRGVLLTGAPGTGKTLLAKAVAGEADVPFFSMSASEFVEMFVGVGASRVRDLFEQAKQEAPAIVFIDELDALGRSRAAASMPGGGHDEREQTLNQVLTEMDGFTGNEGVIVLAATNRPEILDAALLRAGRFDRRVAVNPPDQKGREAILKVHTRSVPLAKDADLAGLAASTPGMVGADLRNLVNEAALLAARRGRITVGRDEFAGQGLVTVVGAEGLGPYGVFGESDMSERTRQLLDAEVRRIADECHQRALETLREHREQLDALAHALLERETLDEADAYAAAGIPHVRPVEATAAAVKAST